MGGMVKGKSDPYIKINVGGVSFKSHVIKENLNPTWNEMYEVRCVATVSVWLSQCVSTVLMTGCLMAAGPTWKQQRGGDQVGGLRQGSGL